MYKDWELYQLTQEEDIWVDYDPQRTRLTLQKSAGALQGVDREELLNDIKLGRQQDSQGRPASPPQNNSAKSSTE